MYADIQGNWKPVILEMVCCLLFPGWFNWDKKSTLPRPTRVLGDASMPVCSRYLSLLMIQPFFSCRQRLYCNVVVTAQQVA
jgi:hypothetical protein